MRYNLAAFAGAGIFNAHGATGTLTGSGVAYNGFTAVYGNTYGTYWEVGGGIYNDGTLTLSGSNVIGNYVSYKGGGIYNDYSGKLIIQSSSRVESNWYYDLYNVGRKGNVKISKDSAVGSTYGL